MKKIFRSRKDVSKYLLEKGIDTSRWSEEKWLSLNKGQAEIHMMALAEAMWDAYQESTPKVLKEGKWQFSECKRRKNLTHIIANPKFKPILLLLFLLKELVRKPK